MGEKAKADPVAVRVIETARECLDKAIAIVKPGVMFRYFSISSVSELSECILTLVYANFLFLKRTGKSYRRTCKITANLSCTGLRWAWHQQSLSLRTQHTPLRQKQSRRNGKTGDVLYY